MEGRPPSSSGKQLAVVTGGNKGIGLEICRQLASAGVKVILTARVEERGMEAVRKLKESGVSDVIFHQLDVTDSSSIVSLGEFVRSQFGKLDILVNNAGVLGIDAGSGGTKPAKLDEIIPGEELRKELSDIGSLTEERLDEFVDSFLKDFKSGLLQEHGWPTPVSAYKVSKLLVNAYARILAKNYTALSVNSVCPGYVRTDINFNNGILTVEEGAKGPVMLALGHHGESTGQFYRQAEVSTFEE